jgi:hypothetical protein
MDHTTIDGLKKWYAKKFEMYGWLLLEKEHGNLYKILNYNACVKQLYHDIERRLKSVHDKDNKKDLEIMLENLQVLCKSVKKDLINNRGRSLSPRLPPRTAIPPRRTSASPPRKTSASPPRKTQARKTPARRTSPARRRSRSRSRSRSPKAKAKANSSIKLDSRSKFLKGFSENKIKEALDQLNKGLKGKPGNKTNINKLLMELKEKYKFSKYVIARPPTHDINDIISAYVYHYLDNRAKSKSPSDRSQSGSRTSEPRSKSKSPKAKSKSPRAKSKSPKAGAEPVKEPVKKSNKLNIKSLSVSGSGSGSGSGSRGSGRPEPVKEPVGTEPVKEPVGTEPVKKPNKLNITSVSGSGSRGRGSGSGSGSDIDL